jgi:hypothetical protein
VEYHELIGKEHFIMSEEGFFEARTSLVFKGTVEDQLERMSQQLPFKVANIAEIGGRMMHMSRLPSTRRSEPVFLITTALDKLKFNTTYEVIEENGEKWMSPTFRSNNANHPSYSLDWVVPLNMALYITFSIHRGAGRNGNMFAPHKCWLHCRCDSGAPDAALGQQWYCLPTGNVYEDSAVCFGANFEERNSVIECASSNIDLFFSTPWNADLLENKRDKAIHMFRYSVENNTQLDPAGDNPVVWLESFHNTALNDIQL